MATRGTAMLITNEMVQFGPEFNGDMFPKNKGGLGCDFHKMISKVENTVDFIKTNNSFNKYNHGYSNIMGRYQGKFNHEDVMENEEYSMNKIVNEIRITSDYLFVKNASQNTIIFNLENSNKKISVEPGGHFRTYFGELVKKNVKVKIMP